MIDYKNFLEASISAISWESVKECISEIKDLVQNNIKRTTLLFNEQDLENNIIDEFRKTSKWAKINLRRFWWDNGSKIRDLVISEIQELNQRLETVNFILTAQAERPVHEFAGKVLNLRDENRWSILDVPPARSGRTIWYGSLWANRTSLQYMVKEVTCDRSPSMMLIAA